MILLFLVSVAVLSKGQLLLLPLCACFSFSLWAEEPSLFCQNIKRAWQNITCCLIAVLLIIGERHSSRDLSSVISPNCLLCSDLNLCSGFSFRNNLFCELYVKHWICRTDPGLINTVAHFSIIFYLKRKAIGKVAFATDFLCRTHLHLLFINHKSEKISEFLAIISWQPNRREPISRKEYIPLSAVLYFRVFHCFLSIQNYFQWPLC